MKGQASSDGLRNNWQKLEHRRFHNNIRNKLTVRVTAYWNRLPMEIVEFSFSENIQDQSGHVPVQPSVRNLL